MARGRSRSVAEEIGQRLDRLTPTERRPAHALLANYPIAGLETVAQFARQAGVSGPTVLRFIGKLGFSGYAEFQRVLREELKAQLESPLTKKPDEPANASRDFGSLDRFSRSAMDNIERSLATVAQTEFDAVVALLADSRRQIFLIGGRFTGPLAEYFSRHLHTLRANVIHIEAETAVRLDYLLDLRKRDVLVAFDVRRYQGDVVHFAEQAAGRGATVVLFTDQWLSPISRVAKHIFPLRIEVPSSWDSAVASLTLVEAMIASLTDRQWPKVKQRIKRLETLRGSLDEGSLLPRAPDD
jgi:DNA-binding MurR/RpiR family transcriptional regulator